ncbi:MAG: hypothetical protein HZB42_05600 [Sphingobacteriales bacterium]|nr:hypothetical protein [Sphingobacteriales bacterium]
MAKWLKKTLKITGISILSLILFAFLIPVVFKKQVQRLVKKEINKQLNATVDFKDVKLSLFRHFPKATISIKGLSIVGKDYYSKDTLIAATEIDVTAGLFSVLGGKNIKVNAVYLESPRIHLLNNQFGKNNWDIARSSASGPSTDTSASKFSLSLKKYKITDGYLVYSDKQANSYLELNNLNHEGSGNLMADVFTLSTSTQSSSAYYTQDDIPYLYNTKTNLDADIKIDTRTNTYTFKTDDVKLNDLTLSADGLVQTLSEGAVKTDIKFSSPTNDFKTILSMVPAVYTKDFKNIKTSGEASFKGFVKGISSASQTPGYDINLVVKNGSFQYPDLPKPVKNINLSLRAVNPDGKPDNAVIDIPKGHIEFDNKPFDFNFTYKNPETIQYIDAGAKGNLDLSEITKFIKLDPGTKLAGQVWADAFAKGPLKALQNQSGAFSAGGFFDIKNLFYSDKTFPQPIQNGNIKAILSNAGGIADKTVIDISSAHIQVGNDPVDFSLQLTNPVSTVNFSGHAKGRFTLDHLKQFTSLPSGTAISGLMNADMGFTGSKAAINKEEYDKITLSGNADFTNVNYTSKEYPTGVSIPSSQLVFNPKNVTLNNLLGKYQGTNFSAGGTMNNLVGYMMKSQPLTGTLNAKADNINLNDWMGTPVVAVSSSGASSNVSSTSSKPFLVPANMNFTVNASAGKLTYDKVDYSNISGTFVLDDEKINLQNVKANALEGTIAINGSYSTKLNKEKPDISFSYDVKNMDVQKAFNAYNTIQFLMPIGKFLSGKLHSQLALTGNLKADMMPLLNSLTGKGNLLLLEGVLAKFVPLEKIATILDIQRLKSISLKEIKNYIEFANGKVLVKPFTVKIDSIEMLISGFHSFDQSIDYAIQMKLPRTVMGAKGNAFVNNLAAEAAGRGIPFKPGQIINLSIKVNGTISNPVIGINFKGMVDDIVKDMEQQAKDFVKAKLDSATQKTRDSLNAIKKQAEDKVKEKLSDAGIDTSNLKIENAKDTLLKNVTDTLKKKLIKKLFGN